MDRGRGGGIPDALQNLKPEIPKKLQVSKMSSARFRPA